jgi:nucleotide-binding universal stress UspA family protein
MSWARILAPMSGAAGDRRVLEAAAEVARPFGAEVRAVYAPADVADLMPWMGEGFMGGVQIAAVESLKEAAVEGEKTSRDVAAHAAGGKVSFIALQSPVWAALAMEARLSDVVVFDDDAARGRGPLGASFQQMIADEQRPILVARSGLKSDGCIAIAWDGGKEATRAVRTALPLLEKAARVAILSAPASSSREFSPEALQEFLLARNVKAEVTVIQGSGDAGPLLLNGAKAAGADILVAGAFGHPRLQEFIFGGTTRTLLNANAPSLFLSH